MIPEAHISSLPKGGVQIRVGRSLPTETSVAQLPLI